MHESLRRSLTIVIAARAFPAQAAFVDDAALAQGPLDLKRFVANKQSAGGPIHISVVTYGTWKAKLLDVDGPKSDLRAVQPRSER